MSSLAACFKINNTPKEAQAEIREMVQDHKDNGSENPALDALNDMIKMAEAKRPDMVAKLEAAGGQAPSAKSTEHEESKITADTETAFQNLMDPDFGNSLLSDDLPTIETVSSDKHLPESWPERSMAFADFFYKVYEDTGWKYNNITQARNAVAAHFGLEESGPFKKAVDEGMEYAVVQISRAFFSNGLAFELSQKNIFDNMVRLYSEQPRLGTRTTESIQNQAYSTPAPIAYLANVLAGMGQRRGQVVYEPTAGTGMLLMGADPDSVITGDMDPTRIEILKDQGFASVISGNALDHTPAGLVDILITNPPFGKIRDENRVPEVFTIDGFETKEIDQAITLHGLENMAENGRAVLIIGGLNKQVPEDERASKYNSGSKKRYFRELYKKYNVVDHFTISGDLYNKQGAGWPIDVIVIEGKGQSEKATPGFQAPPIYKTFDEIGERLEKISTQEKRNFGVDATRGEQEEANPNRGPRTIATGSPYVPGSAVDGSASVQTLQPGQKGSGTGTSGTERPNEQAGQDRTPAIRSDGRNGALAQDITDSGRELGTKDVPESGHQGEGTGGSTGSQGATGANDNVSVAGSAGGRSRGQVIASKGQALYKPESNGGEIGTLTPVNMSKHLQDALKQVAEKHGSVDSFVQTYLKYNSPEELYKAFSAEQIDAVALALDNIRNGNGFILGDQTGIGKGRVVAAMIRYAHNEGKIPVFMTEKQALFSDMYRDMIDIGFDPGIVDEIMQTNNDTILLNEDDDIKLTSPTGWASTLGETEGMPTIGRGKNEQEKSIVFTTYDQLNIQFERKGSDIPAPRRRFLQQLMKNKQVVLIMDEAHNAGGSGDLENLRPDKKTKVVPHPRALLMRQLIPLADGVIYSSATYAKNPDVMDLYSATDLKLGVGGDIGALASAVTSGGIPFQQITAGMLTQAGQYIRRERSFDGVTYKPLVMEVDTKVAEDVSSAMAQIRNFEEVFITPAFEQDGEATGSNAVGGVGEQAQTFTSLMHNIIDQMLLALKVKPSVEEAIRILKKGEADSEQVVLTVSNTMGAFIERYATDNKLEEGDEVKAEFNDLLQRYHYNTRLYTTDEVDENGDKVKFWLDDEMLGEQGVQVYNQISMMIGKLKLEALPVSPVDFMLNELKKAGFPGLEITGRAMSIDYSGDVPVLSKRDPFDRTVNGRNKTIRNYNDGKNRAIILNRSGSTGISLHASERNPVTGQGKRHMIVVQAEKDINVHMQMLGRVHRTGQVIEPAYIQAVANIPAEMKPAALLLARMSSLSANTTADADSLFTDKGTVNFLNKYGDRVAAEALHANPMLNRLLGSPMTTDSKGKVDAKDLIKKVTGRLPLLPINQQEQVYAELIEAYKDLIAELDSTGKNDLEAKTFDLDARTIKTMEISPKSGESPFESAANGEKVDMKRIGKPYSSDELIALTEENAGHGEEEATQALAEFEIYRAEALSSAQTKIDEAETDAARAGAEKVLSELTFKLNADIDSFKNLNNTLKVGYPITIDLNMGKDEPAFYGVVVDKLRRGNPRNPLALSTWRVKVAVADGIRIVNLPFSKLSRYSEDGSHKIKIGPWTVDIDQAAKRFDKALTNSREERWLITGNLFTGYSTFQKDNGQIIHFTRDNGETEQGVLMPRGFNPVTALSEAPVAFENVDQMESFLEAVSPAIIKLRQPGELMIVNNNGRMIITTHKSVSKGGRFFKDDRALLKITGSFTSTGNRMVSEPLGKDQIKQVMELFLNRGNTWFADMGITEARGIINGKKLSVGKSQIRNPANIEEELRAELGGNLDTLLNSGKVRISNQAEATGKKSQKGKVQGFTKSNNTVTLIQGNIEAGNAWSVFLHELGVHTGQLLMSNKEFQGILESLEKRKNEDSATGKAIRAAYTRVPKKTKPEHVLEEVLAYMVENNSETTLVRRVIAIVKKTLLKFGISADIMNNEDLTALAVIAVKRQASQGVNQNDETINGRSEGEEAPGNKGRVSKLRREVGRMGEGGRGSSTNDSTRFSKLAKGKEPRAFTKDDLESDEFKEFFGDSKILDDDGEPLEVFFGSESFGTKDSSDYWTFGAREGKKTNSPEAGLGQYFTTDKTEAMGYTRGTGNVKGFYLRLERPLKIHSSKLPHFSGKAEAAAWAKRKKELDGHDGLVLTDRDHIVIFDKNQAKSSEVTTGEFSRDNDDTRYSVAAEPLTTEFLEETAGSITYHKNEKIDSNFLDRIFSTPEYYFKKFAAAGRVLQAALLRRDIRYTKETEILGDFVKYIQKLRKTDKKAYKEANDYLINTDQEVDGFRIESSKDDDSWTVIAPLWAVNGDKNKQTVGIFSDEAEAVKEMIEAEALAMQRVGYSMEAIKAVTMARELTNRGFDVMAEDMRKIIREAKENGQPDPFIGDGKLNEAGRYGIYEVGKKRPIALFASQREAEEKMAEAAEAISYIIVGGNGKLKNFKNQMRAKAYAKKHSGTVKGQKVFGNLTVKRRSDADMRPLTVKEALAQMGDLRGVYFPRIRESGEYVLIARKDGENPIRKHFDVPAVGDSKPTIQSLLNSVTPMGREAKRLKLKGYTVTVKKDDSPAEDVFEATNLVTSLDAILQGSLSTINKNDSDDVKAGQHINQILTMQVADIFKSRGYLSSRIKRLAGDEIWEGYEEDMGKALTQYGKNVAAGTAKRDTARAMVLAFSGRDYSWAEYKEEVDKPDYAEYEKIVEKRRISERSQKNLFRDVRSFMIDILRNDEQADRIMGTFKGLAVLKYLGFRVSSATVNMTNMVQGVPATIAGHTGESLKDSVGRVIAAATVYGKYRSGKGSVSQADRDIFEYISKKGWDEAQFNHEAASELRGKLGEKWNKFMTASMFMFGAAEKANRAMTLFAAYKAVKEKNTNMSEPLVWEKAKEISDRAHGIYGKETIPAWARGKYNILRLTYTFQKFSHNYMLNMIDLGFTKKEYKAAAYMLLSPALLAGSSASLAGPALFALASALGIGGDDPEEEFYKWAEDTFGGETFARHGIFGALAGINIKGSLQMNNPMPTNLKELAGPVGGILGDTVKGFEHLFKGELAKGAESLLPTAFGSFSKATREATEGITTGNYGSVFYGDEPLRADAADAFIRFLSFNPSRLSGIREKQWHERKVKADYQADKTAIYAKIKRLNLKGMSITPELYKEIYAYNYRVSSSGRRDLSRITGSSIRTMLKRNQKASKLERERAVN